MKTIIAALGLLSLVCVAFGQDCPQKWFKTSCPENTMSNELHCPYADEEAGFEGVIPCGLQVGRKIVIEGTANEDANSIMFDLTGTTSAGKIVGLHMENNLNTGMISLNNNLGSLGSPVSFKSSFKRGDDFTATIEITASGFKISENENLIGNFNRPWQGVSHIKIHGDMYIGMVCFN